MVDLSIRVVDGESQIFRKNLKFKFLAIKQQILRSFPSNATSILLTVIFKVGRSPLDRPLSYVHLKNIVHMLGCKRY